MVAGTFQNSTLIRGRTPNAEWNFGHNGATENRYLYCYGTQGMLYSRKMEANQEDVKERYPPTTNEFAATREHKECVDFRFASIEERHSQKNTTKQRTMACK